MSKLEMIFVDDQGRAYKTGVGAMGATEDETLKMFSSARSLEDRGSGEGFLLDLLNESGEVVDTIPLSRSGFEQISGEKAKSADEYREFDKAFWSGVKAEVRAGARLVASSRLLH